MMIGVIYFFEFYYTAVSSYYISSYFFFQYLPRMIVDVTLLFYFRTLDFDGDLLAFLTGVLCSKIRFSAVFSSELNS